jgi:uncharacterized protein (DUF2237 family)
MPHNLLGTELIACSTAPMTGFYRDGCCRTGGDDAGVHTVCAEVSDEFLAFSRAVGNDLSTPRPEFAYDAGVAPPVVLAASHIKALDWCEREALFSTALDGPDGPG